MNYQVNIFPLKQIYPSELELNINDLVVIKTNYGSFIGKIEKKLVDLKEIKNNSFFEGEITRIAARDDLKKNEANSKEEKEILYALKQKVIEFNLEMNLVKVSYSLENKTLIIFFSSDKMIDFRELLHYLSNIYHHTKLRLENIGDSREVAKISDSYGICGLKQCCTKGINNFSKISKSAIKTQNLPTNLIQHLGNCNKLRCCLMFEEELYKELTELLPKKGSTVIYQNEKYRVVKTNLLLQLVTIAQEKNGEEISLEVSNSELNRL